MGRLFLRLVVSTWTLAGCTSGAGDDTAGDTADAEAWPGDEVPVSYVIGTADDEFGDFPFPPWDVIDPATGANIGLDGQFVEAICARNARMECELVARPYSDCGTGDPLVLGEALEAGTIDGCANWAQTPRRIQAGATFGPAVQSERFAPRGVLIRDADAAPLGDTSDALNALGSDSIGSVSGFAADTVCLRSHYPASTDLEDKVVAFTDGAELFAAIADGSPPYGWVLATEASFPPPGTELAHVDGAAKNAGYQCGGPFALMVYEQSEQRRGMSTLLRHDAWCGAALVAAASELEAGDQDFTLPDANNGATSNTDLQDIACGRPVPTETDDGVVDEDHRDLCALDSEIPLPTLDCLEANGLLEGGPSR